MNHYLLIYELHNDYLERRGEFRDEHLKLAWEATGNSGLILGGALDEPADRAVLLFEGDSPEAAQQFAENDPYVVHGLVKLWSIRPWTTVVGESASNPVR